MDEFLSGFRISDMEGAEKLLVFASFLSGGMPGAAVSFGEVQKGWPAYRFNGRCSPQFYAKALRKKWVARGKGTFSITDNGRNHLATFVATSLATGKQGLVIFDARSAHSFDKELRSLFTSASSLRVADTFVDSSIFDTILDALPKSANLQLLFGRIAPATDQPAFEARMKRFALEYTNFESRVYPDFHDRFFVVDGRGFTLGPSLKDAAGKKPATIVGLDAGDSKTLDTFFDSLWTLGS